MVTSSDWDYSDFLHSDALDGFLLSTSPSDLQPFILILQCYLQGVHNLDTLIKFSEMEIIGKDKVLLRSFCSALFALATNVTCLKLSLKEDISKGMHYKSRLLLELGHLDGDLIETVVYLLNTVETDTYHSLFYSYLFEFGDDHFTNLFDLQQYFRKIFESYSNLKYGVIKRLSSGSTKSMLKLCLIFVGQDIPSIQKLGYLLFKSIIPLLCERSYRLLVKRILDPKKYPTIFLVEKLPVETVKNSNYNMNNDDLDDEAMLKMDTLFEKIFRDKKMNMMDISARNLKLFRIVCENIRHLPVNIFPLFLGDLIKNFSERLPANLVSKCMQALPETIDSQDVARLLSIAGKDISKLANLLKKLCHIESAHADIRKFLVSLILSNKKMIILLYLIRSFTKDQSLGLGKYLLCQSFTMQLIIAIEKLPQVQKSGFCKGLESYVLFISHHCNHSDMVSYFVSCILNSNLANFFQRLLMRTFDSLSFSTRKSLYLYYFETKSIM